MCIPKITITNKLEKINYEFPELQLQIKIQKLRFIFLKITITNKKFE